MKIAAGAVIGLFLLDRMVLSPFLASWKTQGERIADLRQKVGRGRQLLDREKSLRDRWAEMQRTDMPEDVSKAESEVYKAISRWASESHVSFTNLTPQWRPHREGYDTFECLAGATGDQAALARLLYEIETDALPARIEECELTTRGGKGKELALTSLKFSFVRINGTGRSGK